MSNAGCKYCGRPRGGFLDTFGDTRLCSPIDMPELQEILPRTSPECLDSELCPACHATRNRARNDAKKVIEEFGRSPRGREKISWKIYEELQALEDEVDQRDEVGRPAGRVAFDGYVSVVRLHSAGSQEIRRDPE